MANLVAQARRQIEKRIRQAIDLAVSEGALPQAELPEFTVEIPADTGHGDFAANVAMVCAKAFRMAPAKAAGLILDRLDLQDTCFQRAELAGPGFLNFFLRRSWFSDVLAAIRREGADYGRSDYGKGKKVNVEFVSANPTGPMHMGNARGGAIGDCLAAAMEAAGYEVTREFYINDAGNQVEKFACSLEARYLQIYKGEEAVPFPEDGYHGDDIRERAQEFAGQYGGRYLDSEPRERRDALVAYALPRNIQKLKADLERYRITYDVWFPESALHPEAVEEAVGALISRGLTYEKDGAVWYKATEFGAEKDEVLIRANGYPTYLAADIAYHYNKLAVRGFDIAIDIWGADHHGHVARLKGAMDAVGLSGDRLDIILMQLVRLMKDGEPYRMSKRSGKSVTLEDLLELVPVDAARFFFNMREPNSALDFDLDLAVRQSAQNPVYYVQYAHARVCSLYRVFREEGIPVRPPSSEELLLLDSPEETELIRLLARYPEEIIAAARSYDPASLTRYAVDLATLFHKFYTAHRIKGEEEGLMMARLELAGCFQTTLRNLLALLKINAPESM